MQPMNKGKEFTMHLNWLLIVELAIFGLIRHLLDILNLVQMNDGLASPVMTVLISLVWLAAVIIRREPYPLGTLVAVGIVHGLLVLLIALTTPIIPTGPEGFVPLIGLVGILAANTIWGAVVGLVAQVVHTTFRR
jgi:hypothetical protein